jgi:small-conductance mechanosensitive channel
MAKSLGWETFLDRYDTHLDIAKVFGVLIEILFILLFLTVFFDIVGLEQADSILMAIINYYPNILISIVIFIFAIYIANFSKKIVLVSLEKQKITYSGILGDILAGATWILAVLSILYQLKIVPTLVLSIFIGIVALLVLSFGLAFGLGGKDLAKKLLEDWKNQIK